MNFDKEYDIAVAGAGIAGIAAAVQAAREGKKTCIIEKTVLPGGLATNGLVFIYLPICDGNGHQVSFGLTEELLQLSMKYGPGSVADWQNGKNAPEAGRYRCIFSPAAYMLALEELLTENGVDIWYDTRITDVEKDEKRILSVIVENESGRGRITAKQFVDASGSAILARRAGLPCEDEFNFLSIWGLEYQKGAADTPMGEHIRMHSLGVPWDPAKCKPEELYRGISGKKVTDFVLKSRKLLLDNFKKEYAAGTSRDDFYALKLAAMPQFRKIYALKAAYMMNTAENNKPFEDSVGLVPDWRKAGPVWEIPYRSLYPENGFGGLLCAGRCMGARGDAWEIMRVIPSAGLTGQVAGLAASMSIDSGVEPCDLEVKALQARLRKLGFALHVPETGVEYA